MSKKIRIIIIYNIGFVYDRSAAISGRQYTKLAINNELEKRYICELNSGAN